MPVGPLLHSTCCWVRDRTGSKVDPAGRSWCRQKAGGGRVNTRVLTTVPRCFRSHEGILSILGNRAEAEAPPEGLLKRGGGQVAACGELLGLMGSAGRRTTCARPKGSWGWRRGPGQEDSRRHAWVHVVSCLDAILSWRMLDPGSAP